MKNLRPTSSKVRQALFNILFDISDLNFLDLFAGTGEIGLTALKKGAKHVTFVEIDRRRCSDIKKKAPKGSKVVCSDALKFLRNYKGKPFDIIFADPPYDYKLYNELIKEALKHLSEGGVFILEHRADKHFNSKDEKRYGDTILSFWRN